MIEVIEYIIIISIIVLQIIALVHTNKETKVYETLFDSATSVNTTKLPQSIIDSCSIEEIIDIAEKLVNTPENERAIEIQLLPNKKEFSFLTNKGNNEVIRKVVNQVNSYLYKNISKTIDFHIIQNVVDRNIETQEERLERLAPTPLYLGLAATMLGIIFGLSSISFEDVGGIDIIAPLIQGVRLAMIASVTGLIMTTYLSVITIRKAKYYNETKKNDFLSFVQAELMPKMNKAKMPEVKELSDNLKQFSESSLHSVTSLTGLVQQSSESLKIEAKILASIQALDLKKLSTNTLEIFQQSYGLIDNLKDFNQYYIELNQSLKSTTQLVEKLDGFVKNTDSLNVTLAELKDGINRSSEATLFFNKHIESFSLYNDKVNAAVGTSDVAFKESILSLKEITEQEISGIGTVISKFDKTLSETFETSSQKYLELARDEQVKLVETFKESKSLMQKLNKLDNLDKLENTIKNSNKDVIKSINNLGEIIISSNAGVPTSEIKDFISKGKFDLQGLLSLITYSLISIVAILYIIKYFFF